MTLFPTSRTMVRRAAATALVAVAALASVNCGDDATGPGSVQGVLINVLPLSTPTTNVLRGITIQLQAVPFNGDSDFVNTPVTWTSSDDAKATVDNTGLVTTIAGGDVTITAAVNGKSADFPINIQFPVGTVAVSTPAGSIRNEGTVALTATVTGTDGNPAIARTVAWSSSNTAVATVSSTGVVSGVSNGTVTITATSEGVSGTTTVVVSGIALINSVSVTPASPFKAVAETQQMTQTDKAQSGTTLPTATPTWTSSSTSKATITSGGLATCVAAGSSTLSATVDNGAGTNVSGSTTLTCAAALASGVTTVTGTIAPGTVATYAITVPAGATNLNVTVTGGNSDADGDVYIFAPGTAASALNSDPNASAYSNATAVGGRSGTVENVNIANPAAGTWRISVLAWGGANALTAANVKATITP